MSYNVLAFVLLASVIIGGALFLGRQRKIPFPIRLIMVGVGLRVVGSLLRYEVMRAAYGFVGDAQQYYQYGLAWSRRLWSGDWSVLHGWFTAEGAGGGTAFVGNLSGLVVSIIGPSLRAEYLVFSLAAFMGVYWMAKAVAVARDDNSAVLYASIAWVWPSVWFWPSSVGKEAVIFFGLGLALLGFVGTRGRYRLIPMAAGVAVMFLVRPHFAILVAAALGTTHWIMSFRRLNARHVLEGIAIGAAAILVLQGGASRLGIGDLDAEGISEFVAFRSGQTVTGGSAIGPAPTGVLGVPMAFVNVWMRPFPWEAHSATALLSALEVLLLWALIFRFRREIRGCLRLWRRDRFVTAILLLLVAFTLVLGLAFGNLGIIARQRSPLLALFLMLPYAVRVRGAERSPERERARTAMPVPEAASSGTARTEPA